MSTAAAALSLCLAVAGAAPVAVPAEAFVLSWTHSVEKITWRETWAVTPTGLAPVEAAVQGTGAGMEPPPEAVVRDGWYVYAPDLPPVPEIVVPDSAFTGPMTLCAGGTCRPLAAWAGRPRGDARPIRLAPCAGRG